MIFALSADELLDSVTNYYKVVLPIQIPGCDSVVSKQWKSLYKCFYLPSYHYWIVQLFGQNISLGQL